MDYPTKELLLSIQSAAAAMGLNPEYFTQVAENEILFRSPGPPCIKIATPVSRGRNARRKQWLKEVKRVSNG